MATEQKTNNQIEVGDTVYVTKWLLSKGIVKATVDRVRAEFRIIVKLPEGRHELSSLDWYRTLAQAKRRANFLIRRKRQSAEKLLAKLSELEESLNTVTVKARFAGRGKPLPYPTED